MKKIDQQDVLIREYTTTGTREERHDVLTYENGKHS